MVAVARLALDFGDQPLCRKGREDALVIDFEDVDLGMRLRRARWRVVFLPMVAVMHVGGGSVGVRAQQWYDRSLVQLYAKHYGGLWAAGMWWGLWVYRRLKQE